MGFREILELRKIRVHGRFTIAILFLTVTSGHGQKSTSEISHRNAMSSSSVTDLYDYCGISHACWGCDETLKCTTIATVGCLANQNCAYFAAINVSRVEQDGEVEFAVYGRIPDPTKPYWVGIGISTSDKMVKSSIVTCEYLGGDKLQAVPRYSPYAGPPQILNPVPEGSFTFVYAVLINDILACAFRRNITSVVSGETFDLKESLFKILVASGPIDGTGEIQGHPSKKLSPALNLTQLTPSSTPVDSFYDGCGDTKGCFFCSAGFADCALNSGCGESRDCTFAVNIDLTEVAATNRVTFSFFRKMDAGTTLRWVGLGISADSEMGKDSIVTCEEQSDGTALARPYFSSGGPGLPELLTENLGGIFDDPSGSYEDGYLICSYKRNVDTEIQGEKFNLKESRFHLLLARGPMSTTAAGTISGHGAGGAVSSPAFLLTDPTATTFQPELFYEGCGVSKGCFGCDESLQDCSLDSGCLQTRDCSYVVNYEADGAGDSAEVEMSIMRRLGNGVTSPTWLGVGINDMTHMGNASMVTCEQSEDGQVVPRAYFGVVARGRPQLLDQPPPDSFIDPKGASIDGYLTCSYKRKVNTEVNGISFNLADSMLYILLAAGNMEPGQIGYHGATRKHTPTSLNLTATSTVEPTMAPPSGMDEFYEGCGDAMGCIGCVSEKQCGSDVSCIKARNCPVMLNYGVRNDIYDFNFYASGPAASWVGMAFSRDPRMGPSDSAVICRPDDQGGIRAHPYWLTGRTPPTLLNQVESGVLMDSSASYKDGFVICSFSREAVTVVNDVEFDFRNSSYFLLLAKGPWGSGVPEFHTIYGTGASAIDLNDVAGSASKSRWRLEAHAICMILAWIGSASCGIITARYYKKSWVGMEVAGKAIWFVLHVMYMLTTFVLSVAGFAFILDELQEFEEGAHPYVGLASLILAFIQPFMALMRCDPDHPRRPIFNWAHFCVGNSAHILAVVNIFLAVDMEGGGLKLPYVAYWILTPAVTVYVLAHVVLTVSEHMTKNSHNFTMSPEGDDGERGANLRRIVFLVQLVTAWTIAALLCAIVTGTLEVSQDGKHFAWN